MTGNEGVVWLEDCELTDGNPGIEVTDTDALVMARCRVTAGAQGDLGFPGDPPEAADALHLEGSLAAVYDTVAEGGKGLDGDPAFGTGLPGGAGARLVDATLVASRADLLGGAGGNDSCDVVASCSDCVFPQAGGVGIALIDADAALHDTALAGGPGSFDETFFGNSLADGPDGPRSATAGASSLVELDDQTPLLATSSPVRELEPLEVTPTAAPDDLLLFLVGAAPAALPLASVDGMIHVAAPFDVVTLAPPVPATFSVTVPALPPGAPEALVVHLQVAAAGATFGTRLGSPSAVVVLDATF